MRTHEVQLYCLDCAYKFEVDVDDAELLCPQCMSFSLYKVFDGEDGFEETSRP